MEGKNGFEDLNNEQKKLKEHIIFVVIKESGVPNPDIDSENEAFLYLFEDLKILDFPECLERFTAVFLVLAQKKVFLEYAERDETLKTLIKNAKSPSENPQVQLKNQEQLREHLKLITIKNSGVIGPETNKEEEEAFNYLFEDLNHLDFPECFDRFSGVFLLPAKKKIFLNYAESDEKLQNLIKSSRSVPDDPLEILKMYLINETIKTSGVPGPDANKETEAFTNLFEDINKFNFPECLARFTTVFLLPSEKKQFLNYAEKDETLRQFIRNAKSICENPHQLLKKHLMLVTIMNSGVSGPETDHEKEEAFNYLFEDLNYIGFPECLERFSGVFLLPAKKKIFLNYAKSDDKLQNLIKNSRIVPDDPLQLLKEHLINETIKKSGVPRPDADDEKDAFTYLFEDLIKFDYPECLERFTGVFMLPAKKKVFLTHAENDEKLKSLITKSKSPTKNPQEQLREHLKLVTIKNSGVIGPETNKEEEEAFNYLFEDLNHLDFPECFDRFSGVFLLPAKKKIFLNYAESDEKLQNLIKSSRSVPDDPLQLLKQHLIHETIKKSGVPCPNADEEKDAFTYLFEDLNKFDYPECLERFTGVFMAPAKKKAFLIHAENDEKLKSLITKSKSPTKNPQEQLSEHLKLVTIKNSGVIGPETKEEEEEAFNYLFEDLNHLDFPECFDRFAEVFLSSAKKKLFLKYADNDEKLKILIKNARSVPDDPLEILKKYLINETIKTSGVPGPDSNTETEAFTNLFEDINIIDFPECLVRFASAFLGTAKKKIFLNYAEKDEKLKILVTNSKAPFENPQELIKKHINLVTLKNSGIKGPETDTEEEEAFNFLFGDLNFLEFPLCLERFAGVFLATTKMKFFIDNVASDEKLQNLIKNFRSVPDDPIQKLKKHLIGETIRRSEVPGPEGKIENAAITIFFEDLDKLIFPDCLKRFASTFLDKEKQIIFLNFASKDQTLQVLIKDLKSFLKDPREILKIHINKNVIKKSGVPFFQISSEGETYRLLYEDLNIIDFPECLNRFAESFLQPSEKKKFLNYALTDQILKELIFNCSTKSSCVKNNENYIGKDFSDNKLMATENIVNILHGSNLPYDDSLFIKIYNVDFKTIYNILSPYITHSNTIGVQEIKSENCLLDLMMHFLVPALKMGTFLNEFCLDPIIMGKNSIIKSIDTKTLCILMLERYLRHQSFILLLLKKMGMPLPFAYLWKDSSKPSLTFKFPLKAYSYILQRDTPTIVSLGDSAIGKTTLLNKIFSTEFTPLREGIFNGGVDGVFTCDEFDIGFNIFDVHDDCLNQKNLLSILLKIVNAKKCWFLVQTLSLEKALQITEYLETDFKISSDQIILILRDQAFFSEDEKKKLMSKQIMNYNAIGKIKESSNQFKADMILLIEYLVNIFGIGKSARPPINYSLLKKHENSYWKIEEKLKNSSEIIKHSPKFKEISFKIEKILNEIPQSQEDYHNLIFKHLCSHNRIHEKEKEKKKVKLESCIQIKTDSEIERIELEIKKIKSDLNKSELHEATSIYHDLLLEKSFKSIYEFEQRLASWQHPILEPLFKERNDLNNTKQTLTNDLKGYSESKVSIIQKIKEEINDVNKKILENGSKIDKKAINKDIFTRELFTLYNNKEFLSLHPEYNIDKFIDSVVDHIRLGNEIEIIDGDNNQFKDELIKQIFKNLQEKNKFQTTSPFVVSVIGPQSTGKSTLLNMLFGSNFQMSAGRCTKGLYATIFPTEFEPGKCLLVLDTEGLLSIEKSSEEYDKKLTLFSMATSHVMLINLNGEINASMKKILNISLFAANQLKCLKYRPKLFFILRNMMDLDKKMQRDMIGSVTKELADICKINGFQLDEILDFKGDDSFVLMFSAFNKDAKKNKSDTLFMKSITNKTFVDSVYTLREIIFTEAKTVDKTIYSNLESWMENAKILWDLINYYNDLFLINDLKEINERNKLSQIYKELIKEFIEEGKNDKPNSPIPFTRVLDQLVQKELKEEKKFTDIKESEFDIKSNEIIEKLKNIFEEKVKIHNFQENLKTEYWNRISSHIIIVTDRARTSWRTIIDKKKLGTKVLEGIEEIRSEMNSCVVKWNQNESNSNRANFKSELINNFNNKKNLISIEVINELEKNKKTPQEIVRFTQDIFKSVISTYYVQDRFFALATIDNKRILNNRDYSLFNDLENYKSLDDFNSKIKVANKISNLVEKTIGKPVFSNESEYIDEFGNKKTIKIPNSKEKSTMYPASIKTRRSVFNFFGYGDSTNLSQYKITDSKLYQNVNFQINEKEIESSMAIVFEMKEKMDEIFEDYRNSKCEYSFNKCVTDVQKLKNLKDEINNKYMEPNYLRFKNAFGDEIISYLFDLVVKMITKDEEYHLEEKKKYFNSRLNEISKTFEGELEQCLNDTSTVQQVLDKIIPKLQILCQEEVFLKFKIQLKLKTNMNPELLVQECDQEYAKSDKEKIYEYVDNCLRFMEKKYTSIFDRKQKEEYEQYNIEFRDSVKNVHQDFIKNLESLDKIFENAPNLGDLPESKNKDPKLKDYREIKLFTFFKTYLENEFDAKQIIDEIYPPNQLLKLNTNPKIPKIKQIQAKIFKNDDYLSITTRKIEKPNVFFKCILEEAKKRISKINYASISLVFSNDEQKMIEEIKVNNRMAALGCQETCPYCGAKCTEPSLGGHDQHKTSKHRLMAFKGCYGLTDNKKIFILDVCNSNENVNQSRFKDSKEAQKSLLQKNENLQIKQRIEELHVASGTFHLTLAWNNINDLDLHCKCPCGTEIYYGRKGCPTCNATLDLDMNRHECSNTECKECSKCRPAENIFIKNPKAGLHEFWVHLYNDRTGGETEFSIRASTFDGLDIKNFRGSVSKLQSIKNFDPIETTIQTLTFMQHYKKYYPKWSIEPLKEGDNNRIIEMKDAWKIISDKYK